MEFKIQPGLRTEINTLKASGATLPDIVAPLEKEGVSSLKTAMEYSRERTRLFQLMELYLQLLQKDAKDLNQMMDTAILADSRVAQMILGAAAAIGRTAPMGINRVQRTGGGSN